MHPTNKTDRPTDDVIDITYTHFLFDLLYHHHSYDGASSITRTEFYLFLGIDWHSILICWQLQFLLGCFCVVAWLLRLRLSHQCLQFVGDGNELNWMQCGWWSQSTQLFIHDLKLHIEFKGHGKRMNKQ